MKRFFAIFLATLILVSNSGVVFATHYCMGEISDINVGYTTHALKCDMASKSNACETHAISDENKIEPVDCCKDDYIQIQLNESFDTPVTEFMELNTQFIAAFTIAFLDLYDFQHVNQLGFVDYSPPLLKHDIPVLFQSFLI